MLITRSTSAGSQVLASAIGMGKFVPLGATRPCKASSCVMTGMPRRVFSMSHFCTAFTKTGVLARAEQDLRRLVAQLRGPRELAEPVRDESPRARGSNWPAASVIFSLPFQMPRVCATFSSRVMRARRSRTRSSTGRVRSR
jgi:hypothetical protein